MVLFLATVLDNNMNDLKLYYAIALVENTANWNFWSLVKQVVHGRVEYQAIPFISIYQKGVACLLFIMFFQRRCM